MTPDRYYVIGNPIAHSKSPKIHMQFASKYSQNILYERIEVLEDNLEETLKLIKDDYSVKGLSITLPLKEKVFKFCKSVDKLAFEAKSVSNIAINETREFMGFNLDGLGLLKDIKRNNINTKNKSILILGAGGAAKGIVGALMQEKPQNICIANRSLNKAVNLKNYFLTIYPKTNIIATDINKIENKYDLVINATSASISCISLPLKKDFFNKKAFGYDIMYMNKPTVFNQWCTKNHIQNVDGKGMLLEISKLAFFMWRGISPE